jgi:hypothetical protein
MPHEQRTNVGTGEVTTMPVKRGNRKKRSIKNRAKVKRVAARRKRVRHQKSTKRGMRAR